MDIQNFTNNNIRLGEFPTCVDVSAIKYANSTNNYHTSYGVSLTLFPYDLDECQCKTVIAKSLDTGYIHICSCKFDEQLESFLDARLFPKGAKILYDSRVKSK